MPDARVGVTEVCDVAAFDGTTVAFLTDLHHGPFTSLDYVHVPIHTHACVFELPRSPGKVILRLRRGAQVSVSMNRRRCGWLNHMKERDACAEMSGQRSGSREDGFGE